MIDEELDSELRSIFARAGAGITVPHQARQRLLQRRYHPRTGSRRLAAGITTAAAAAGTAAGLVMLAPADHQPGVQLTAWTVVTQPNGNVVVTIRELRHPRGLQHKLRADGIPASVNFGRRPNPSCRPFAAGEDLIEKVFPTSQTPPSPIQVTIHPSALPSGAGVQIFDGATGQQLRGRTYSIGVGLVHTSPRCTGR